MIPAFQFMVQSFRFRECRVWDVGYIQCLGSTNDRRRLAYLLALAVRSQIVNLWWFCCKELRLETMTATPCKALATTIVVRSVMFL